MVPLACQRFLFRSAGSQRVPTSGSIWIPAGFQPSQFRAAVERVRGGARLGPPLPSPIREKPAVSALSYSPSYSGAREEKPAGSSCGCCGGWTPMRIAAADPSQPPPRTDARAVPPPLLTDAKAAPPPSRRSPPSSSSSRSSPATTCAPHPLPLPTPSARRRSILSSLGRVCHYVPIVIETR